jgi:probable rRNA maturation factor
MADHQGRGAVAADSLEAERNGRVTAGRVPDHVVLVGGDALAPVWAAAAEEVLPSALDRLAALGKAPAMCEVSVSLVGDQAIRELNRQYRGNDSVTDVLSFSQLEGEHLDLVSLPAGVPVPLGDIVISVSRMAEQAAEYGHGERREFGFLLIHGLLHLLGYDHQQPDDQLVMRAMEEDVLAAAGLAREAGAG